MFSQKRIVIKGAGDLATGVAARLWRSGFPVMMTEIEQPLTVRRSVSLSDAVYEGETTVEDMTARRAKGRRDILKALDDRLIPVIVDPKAEMVNEMEVFAVIDAIMAKKNLGTHIDDAIFVVGLGPGFTAGDDVHAIVETKRGHTLGRVIRQGSAIPNTGIPAKVKGFGSARVIRAPGPGVLKGVLSIGTHVEKGDIVAYAGDMPIPAPISGMLRGLLHDSIFVEKGLKSGDVDPRDIQESC
ncbi:MAG: EF2563 family selenium-dependent molybdenum hydroxylase system protein, partial [Deltaproteobacteria bacterium]|nr:EF2563 family selenium-dependent molybdenum hydroxylase system protein [Deltaproteobacteria bacterium]